jgi:hypothetical protein
VVVGIRSTEAHHSYYRGPLSNGATAKLEIPSRVEEKGRLPIHFENIGLHGFSDHPGNYPKKPSRINAHTAMGLPVILGVNAVTPAAEDPLDLNGTHKYN